MSAPPRGAPLPPAGGAEEAGGPLPRRLATGGWRLAAEEPPAPSEQATLGSEQPPPRTEERPSRSEQPQPPAEAGRRAPLEDLALLIAVTAALALPGWLASPSPAHVEVAGQPAEPLRIDVNRSLWYEWTLLEGIGDARARRIVEFRSQRGGFRSLAELEEVPGLPRGWTEKVRPFLILGRAPGREAAEGEGRAESGPPGAAGEGR